MPTSFEKWWDNNSLLTHPSNKKIVAQNAYEAGCKAGLKEAAEIPESTYPELIDGQIEQVFCFDSREDIANAIREKL